MTLSSLFRHTSRAAACIAATATLAACGDTTPTEAPPPPAETLQLTPAVVSALDSTALVIKGANSSNPDVQAVVDSALRVLTAGITAKHLTVTTDLTTAPLYFVGIHRVYNHGAGAWATWTLVGMDDPSKLANLMEIGGFAQAAGSTPPGSVSGTIGVPGNIGNGLLLQIGTGGSATEWRVNSGTASFASDAGGAACPNFQPTAVVTCSIETMHVHFTISGSSGASGARQASIATDVDVPAMRLTYNLP